MSTVTDQDFDVVVIGTGPGGRGVAPALAAEGKRVAVIEDELVGGECPFWACIPSKTLLRPSQLRTQAAHVAGVAVPALDWSAIRDYRDYMNSGLDDGAKADWLGGVDGVTLIRGRASIPAAGRVLVGDRELRCADIVIASGTHPAIPDLPGLVRDEVWTNREVTSLHDVPASAVVLGGGPVGLEVAQYLAGFGCQVTLVERSERPLVREEPEVGGHVRTLLDAHGVHVRTDASIARVEHRDGGVAVHLGDGEVVDVERLIVAAGRSPRTDGLTPRGVAVEHGHIAVDDRCSAADRIWAIGDINGVAPFTHVAGYQARVVVDNILGRERHADYRAVPRVVFTEPEVAAVGLTAAQAAEQGIDAATGSLDLSGTDRTETYGRGLFGGVGAVVDRERGVVVGAWAVGPEAGEWIHTAALAIKAEIPLAVLQDFVPQFPTFNELWGALWRSL
jgi:pyruvate/2-oxoglutarate dehydrogenase complex dihydrolipoamide dehydrogenase (E3) component